MKKMHDIRSEQRAERVFLVGVAIGKQSGALSEELLDELAELARSSGAEVKDRFTQKRPRPDSATFIGSGLLNTIKERIGPEEINAVIFDDPLTPAQQRNLEEALDIKVLDRPRLILDIFASRARTTEAMTQVELAQLQYLLPRLTRAWTHLSRQHGAIGARGPGETQLEVDRRRIGEKIATLKKRLKKIALQRTLRRKGREDLFKISIVGYTNAGKSTIFNSLTKASVKAANQLFMTLDPTSRVMSTPYPRRVVFTDTVGFIRKLPHELVESFKSTLEEATTADVLIHVIDCSDEGFEEKIKQTEALLREIGANAPVIYLYNKVDLSPEFVPPPLKSEAAFVVSAKSGQGMAELKEYLKTRSELRSPTSQSPVVQ